MSGENAQPGTNPQYGEEIIEGVVDKIRMARSTTQSEFERIHLRKNDGSIIRIDNVFAVGSVSDYLREGFSGKVYIAKPTKHDGRIIVGLEDERGNKISDEDERKRVYGIIGVANSGPATMGAIGGAVLFPILLLIFIRSDSLPLYIFASIFGAVVSSRFAMKQGSAYRQIIGYPGAARFVERNGL